MKTRSNSCGFVLTGALMFLLISMMIAGSFIFVSRQSHPAVIHWMRYDQTLLAAQTAMEKVKADLYSDFRAYHWQFRSWNDLEWVSANASSYGTNGSLGAVLGADARYAYSNAAVTATVTCGNVVSVANDRVVLVTNTVTAVFEGVTRTIEEVVRYTLNRSSVFNHSYFINNHGWFYDVNCVVNGDIRSNFDVDLASSSLVLNGCSYAAGVNNVSKSYSSWSWSTYGNNSLSDYFRPTYNVDQKKNSKTSVFEFGYNSSSRYNSCRVLDMPYIDNLGDYKDYAIQNNGTVRTGSTVVVNNVFSGTGPSGMAGAPDKGCIVLVGTSSKPIVIDGPVVVDGDVIIKGYYTGQGTIYAGRNIHIIGNLIAVNPSQWQQPDTTANFTNNTLPDNLDADFLGLCAKGSIVIGDYREFASGQLYYMSSNFVSPYAVSSADADIGYVSYTQNGTNYFDGNYTNTFGTKCGNSVATNGVARKYYESSLSDNKFGSYSPAETVGQIDATLYNNHLTTGKLANNAMFNGAIICRDEALIAGGRFYLNWDPRIALEDRFKPFLPPELGPAETIQWREVP